MKRKILLSFFLLILFGSFKIIAQDIFDACRTGDVARLEQLYLLNSDTLESRNENGFTPLIIATYRNQESCVRFLIEHKVDLNSSSQEGPALLGACYKGNIALASILLENGASVNLGGNGVTPLIFAVQGKNVELTKLLMKFNADPNLKDPSGFTALDYAKNLDSKELLSALSEK